MIAIYKREMRSYFTTPIGYIFCGVFLAVAAFLFCYTTLYAMSSDVTSFYSMMLLCFVVLLPLRTMKLFSEEKRQKTDQLLLTAPVSIWSVVLGKYFAAATIFASVTCFSSLFFLILYAYARVKTAVLFGNLLAVLLVGLAFLAVGIFVSSVTESQLSAAIVTIGVLVVFMGISVAAELISVPWIRFVFECLSVWYRFQAFTQGIFDPAGLVYYLSVAGVFLFLTVRILDRRRWA